MYTKPKLERFGTFRELTQWGLRDISDPVSIFDIHSGGCAGLDPHCGNGASVS